MTSTSLHDAELVAHIVALAREIDGDQASWYGQAYTWHR